MSVDALHAASADASALFEPLTFNRGPTMANRFMLAPLTNKQSHPDGRLSTEELEWLTARARGGFGHIVTCAVGVQPTGRIVENELGVFSDDHIEGLTRLASAVSAFGVPLSAQLNHGGLRSVSTEPVGPSVGADGRGRPLDARGIDGVVSAFAGAARRVEQAGFTGVQLHSAHGYLLAQFLNPTVNRRSDRWGGALRERSRLLFDVIAAIREMCSPDLQLGVRLSPERQGQDFADVLSVAERLVDEAVVDYVDMSLWDVAKEPDDPRFRAQRILQPFVALRRNGVRIGVAGKIRTPDRALECLDAGADFVTVGRSGILHHDLPHRFRQGDHALAALPVSAAHLVSEFLSPNFVDYMREWRGFVLDEAEPEAETGTALR